MECTVQFPDPLKADDEGLVAIGGELSPQYLISAYSQGIFPWFSEGSEILWWSPNPRLVLFPLEFKLRKSLRQVINQNKFDIRVDTNFSEVINNCAMVERSEQDGTWITEEMKAAYTDLHSMGIAHSFESYNKKGELVGGLYGLSLGRAFFGESMFYKERDASKVALHSLVQWCLDCEVEFIDAQQSTSHLKSLGAREVSRGDFMGLLQKSLGYASMVGNWSKFNGCNLNDR